jgi:hypothetical protein
VHGEVFCPSLSWSSKTAEKAALYLLLWCVKVDVELRQCMVVDPLFPKPITREKEARL